MPPFVIEIDKPPITNAGIKAFKPKLAVSGIEYFITPNISISVSYTHLTLPTKA